MKYIAKIEQGTTEIVIEENKGKYIKIDRHKYCGGLTEKVRFDNNLILVCNESCNLEPGKYKDTILIIQYDEVVERVRGNVLFASNHFDRNDPEPWDYYPLSSEQVEYLNQLVEKEKFYRDGELVEILTIRV